MHTRVGDTNIYIYINIHGTREKAIIGMALRGIITDIEITAILSSTKMN